MIARALALLLFATSVNAQVTISTITPANGNVNGGEYVHIHGTHLIGPLLPCASFPTTAACFEFVKFGGVLGQLVSIGDDEIVVMTPPHAAGPVDVEINIPQNADITVSGYRYDDPQPADNVRFLVPVAINTAGAFGSNWVTELAITNLSTDAITVAGATIGAGKTAVVAPPSSSTGAFITVPRKAAANVTMSLHVRDTSRDADSFGTDIPVVAETQFRPLVVLNGIPTDARFRDLLRIYGYGGGIFAHVTVVLRDDASGDVVSTQTVDMSDYAQIGLDGLSAHPRIRAEVSGATIGSSLVPAPPLWAFVSVTNNSTQQVTTITPSTTATSASPALAIGHWAGGGSCADVSATQVQLNGACFVAQFPRPVINAQGQFKVEGTYQTTAGPTRIEPAPPALFTGVVDGNDLTITIATASSSFTIHLTLGSPEPCPQLCA